MIFEKSDPGMIFDGKPLSLGLPSKSLSDQWGQNGAEARQLRETPGVNVYAISLLTICYTIIPITIHPLFHWRRVGKPLFKGSVPHEGRHRATNIRRLALWTPLQGMRLNNSGEYFFGGDARDKTPPPKITEPLKKMPGFYSGSTHFRIVLAARELPPGFFRTFSTPFR